VPNALYGAYDLTRIGIIAKVGSTLHKVQYKQHGGLL